MRNIKFTQVNGEVNETYPKHLHRQEGALMKNENRLT